MSGFAVRGWCPGALRPMDSGDGWVVRVRVPGGRLAPDQARGIAEAALAHGNGLIDLSARASLQIRGVSPESHVPLIEALRGLALIDPDESVESRRNIVVQPFWSAGEATPALAAALAGALATSDLALPGKFGFALDSGPLPVLRGVSADIRIEAAGPAFLVRADGAETGARVPAGAVAETALALARWFVETGGVTGGRGRMAAHVARGTPLPPIFRAHPAAPAPAFLASPGPCPGGALVALAFGQMRAETLALLSDLDPLRLTPWRMLLVEGASAAPEIPGLIADPDDPLLRVVACPGAPACSQGLGPTRALARRIAPLVPPGWLAHVSGCAKGCACPGPADLVLVATGAGYDLVAPGRAGDPPRLRGLAPDAITPQMLAS